MKQRLDSTNKSTKLGTALNAGAPDTHEAKFSQDITSGEGGPITHATDVARAQFVLLVQEKFAIADDDAMFSRHEQSVILNCSLSWLEKGNGPRTRRVGRLCRSTKRDIKDFIKCAPADDETGSLYRFG